MIGKNIVVNGELASPSMASTTLSDTDVTYGYGCYETLKIRQGLLYFPEFHADRLIRSAEVLGIQHTLTPEKVVVAMHLLDHANGIRESNIKIMLIGREGRDADWYIFMLPPIIPPAAAYKSGVSCLLFKGERHFPAAKSLSMLLSTVAYRAATSQGCYDALLVNGRDEITEGTRTNLFYAKRGEARIAYTPPRDDALEGITRRTLIEALAKVGIKTVERPLSVAEALSGVFALAVTSTSSRVIAVQTLVGVAERDGGAGIVPLAASSMVPTDSRHMRLSPAQEIDRIKDVYDDFLNTYFNKQMEL
ncbi:hypothetical protein MASR2M48_24030 [Spirochaetota bacterium]